MSSRLSEATDRDRTPLVLDGGMGRELMRIGAPFRQPEWSALALWEGPDRITRAHMNFIEAGAEVITTNSYAIVPFHIGEKRFAAEGRELAALAGRLARQAADTAVMPVLVAGSLPPPFGSYRPDLFDPAGAPRIIDPLVDGLADHVDVWLGETLSSIGEARAVREALDRAGGRAPLWISFTLAEAEVGTLRSGESVVEAAVAAGDLGAGAMLFNCCPAESIGPAIAAARLVLGDAVAIGGYANRFVTSHADEHAANDDLSSMRDDLGPERYREFVDQWLDAGATLIGGCCGMGPEHTAETARAVADRRR